MTDCAHKYSVVDSRPLKKGGLTRRRRKCRKCGNMITTREIDVEELDIIINSRVDRKVSAVLGQLKNALFVREFDKLKQKFPAYED